jgi:hypothetical protein
MIGLSKIGFRKILLYLFVLDMMIIVLKDFEKNMQLLSFNEVGVNILDHTNIKQNRTVLIR